MRCRSNEEGYHAACASNTILLVSEGMHQNRPITPGAFIHDGYLAVMVVGNLSPLYLALSEVYNPEQLNPLSASTSETSIYHHIEAPDMLGQRNRMAES